MTDALKKQADAQRQLAHRRNQARNLQRQIVSGQYSDEDVEILKGRLADMQRLVRLYADALASA